MQCVKGYKLKIIWCYLLELRNKTCFEIKLIQNKVVFIKNII